jgi:hypothetical protein
MIEFSGNLRRSPFCMVSEYWYIKLESVQPIAVSTKSNDDTDIDVIPYDRLLRHVAKLDDESLASRIKKPSSGLWNVMRRSKKLHAANMLRATLPPIL